VQQHNDPNKRPILTDEQLQVIRRGLRRKKQGTPREEFERLFRGSPLAAFQAEPTAIYAPAVNARTPGRIRRW
jgi:hypothetical protein